MRAEIGMPEGNGNGNGERIARLEVQIDGLRAIILSEARGYIDGTLKSVQHDHEQDVAEITVRIKGLETAIAVLSTIDAKDISGRHEALREIVCGKKGDNGLVSEVRRSVFKNRLQLAIIWALLSWLFFAEFGLKLPILP